MWNHRPPSGEFPSVRNSNQTFVFVDGNFLRFLVLEMKLVLPSCSYGFNVLPLLVFLFGVGCLQGTTSGSLPQHVLAVEPMEDVLPFFDTTVHVGSVRLPTENDVFPPLRVLLSKERYWAQDGHLDAVIQIDPALDATHLRVQIFDDKKKELASFPIDPLPSQNFAIYPVIPSTMLDGGDGVAEFKLLKGDEVLATESRPFRVERHPAPSPEIGSIRLTVPNPTGAVEAGVPVTVGVPFPRGVLFDVQTLRLVDSAGREIPLQVQETGRWSKFGSLSWVLCDFVVELDGKPLELSLEYGAQQNAQSSWWQRLLAGFSRSKPAQTVSSERPLIPVTLGQGFPTVDAGLLKIDGGVWFDANGDGSFVKVLDEGALNGAFVEHEDGRVYRLPPEDQFEIEEHGPEKVVIRRSGWYRHEPDGREFCQYVIRYVIHRNSPLIRVFNTWIYTGDDKVDRIRNMGWQFPLDDSLQPGGFLSSFGKDGRWLEGQSLLQWDYDHFLVVNGGQKEEFPGGRAPGVALSGNEAVQFFFGAADFWQNYPSELEFHQGSFWFHTWPRNNLPAKHTFDKEWIPRPTSYDPVFAEDPGALPSAARYAQEDPDKLTPSEWSLNILQHRYAHEGLLLDFALPEQFSQLALLPKGWDRSKPNAHGIARTDEFWLVFRPATANGPGSIVPLMQGLAEETLRAVVDPVWLVSTEVIPHIHPQDWEQFPEEERSYELAALSVDRIREQLGMYGMWIYGDLPIWGPNVGVRVPNLNRAFRKQHLGWPYPWIPFARSGDPRLLKIAQAAGRRVMDTSYRHYVSEEFQDRYSRGYLGVGPVYWDIYGESSGGARGVHITVDNLIHARQLTGYHRAADHIQFIIDLLKEEPIDRSLHGRSEYYRGSNAELKTYVELYQETFDPWFLVAAHAFRMGHMHGRSREFHDRIYGGRIWDTGDAAFMNFTGDSEFRDKLYLDRIVPVSQNEFEINQYNRRNPQYTTAADAWRLTGEEYHLRRVAAHVNAGTYLIGDGERYPEYLHGYIHRTSSPSRSSGGSSDYAAFTSAHLKWFPMGLRALADAGRRPDPIVDSFQLRPPTTSEPVIPITLRKDAPDKPVLLRLRAWRNGWSPVPFPESTKVNYRILDATGKEMLAGIWDFSERPGEYPISESIVTSQNIEIPAEFPPGVYTVEFHNPKPNTWTLAVPVSERDTPEVLVLQDGHSMYMSDVGTYYFQVPEGVERFWIDSRRDSGGLTMVWDPDGRRVWNQGDHYPSEDHPDEPRTVRAEIEVRPEHAGRLWKISGTGRFNLDPQIPPVFATEPARWFNPLDN